MNDLFEGGVIDRVKTKTMRKARLKGCDCPVCGQFVKVYKRSISSSAAMQLVKAYQKYGADQIFHRSDITDGGGDFAKLRYWGLIKEVENVQDRKKKNSGRWKITSIGREFVLNRTFAAKYVLIYNGKLLDFDTSEIVDIEDCLGNSFNYQELMAA